MSITTKEKYEFLAKQIEREDGLINARLSWMLTFEGLLFAGMSIIYKTGMDNQIAKALVLLGLPLVGVVIAIFARLAIDAALDAIGELKELWCDKEFEGYPRPFGAEVNHRKAQYYSQGIPVVIVFMWVLLPLAAFIELFCG